MTAQDMYKIVKNIMSEKGSSKVFDQYYLDTLSLILAETFNDNNICRMFYNKKPLTEIPYVDSYDTELTYENEYLREVIPYGIAAQLETDDDLTKNGLFATKYSNAKVLHQKAISQRRYEQIIARDEQMIQERINELQDRLKELKKCH